ncbi:hypothetical protein I350_04476 [Cryptococcus amylolentus CBS 6273]|uniref:Aminoglycoside phosphotransferase domain-containing protein n=1 Tax=Cryptococcus amylolentus CBS 6273 TaxID=1296118 RepID=A0A1E3K3L1_9TREE|nr:hypothetical protein I350_04476 [Cryptococcus amylolentus CBS 6273]
MSGKDGRQRTFTTQCPTYDFDICVKRSALPPSSPTSLSIPLGESATALQNEALALAYLKEHTSIPVPKIIASFQDRGATYLLFERLEGVIPASAAPPDMHRPILFQLERYMDELHSHASKTCKSFVEMPLFSPRLGHCLRTLSRAEYAPADKEPYILCHGNLSWEDVLVDCETFDIRCIQNWSFAGFYPAQVEGQYWRRPGPPHALPGSGEGGVRGEEDDANRVVDVLYRSSVDGWKAHIRSARLAAGFEAIKSETSLVLDPEPESQANGKDKGVEESLPQKTRLQKNLSALQFPTHNPSPTTPLTSPLLLLHTAFTTRQGLVRDLEELRVDLEEDAIAWAGLVKGLTGKVKVGDDGDREADGYDNLQTLASLLPPLLQSLSTHLQSSSSSLLPLIPLLSPPSPSSPPKPKLISVTTEEQAGEGYYAKLFLEKMNLKMGKKAGHVWDGGGVEGEVWRRVREGEGEKWVGMKEFSEKVFLISHTALQNLPLLPYPPPSPLPHRPTAPLPTIAPTATSPRQIRFSPLPFSHPNSPPPSSSPSPFPTSPSPHPPFSPAPTIATALKDLALQARLITAKRRADNLTAGGRGYWDLKVGDELEGMHVLGGVQRPLGEGDYVDFTSPSPPQALQAGGGAGEGEGEGEEVRVVGGIRVRGRVPEPENEDAFQPPHIFPSGGMQEKERGHKRSASLFSRVLSLRGGREGVRERTVSMQGQGNGKGKTSAEKAGGEGAGEVMELKRLRKRSM